MNFNFATHAPVSTERHVINSSVAAIVLTQGDQRHVVPEPRAIFVRVDGTITIQSRRQHETVNFPFGSWEVEVLTY
jgi:hypothetical protein